MWLEKRVLSAVVGLSMLGIPPSLMAAGHFDQPQTRTASAWQVPSQHSPVLLADEDDKHEGRRHHHDWDHHDRDEGHHDNDWHRHHWDADDYNWGSRNRYQYTPGWFNGPPPGWARNRRRAYLEQRRGAAIVMQRQMWARGDRDAANRLGEVISDLNNQLGYH